MSRAGFTLLELLIATVLFTVVLLAGSNLLVNFGKFSSDVVKSEASLMETALGAFEQMVGKIEESNEVTIPATGFAAPSIAIRVSPAGAATAVHTLDVYHVYWMTGNKLYYKSATGALPVPAVTPATDTAIARDIQTVSFNFVVSGSVTLTNQVRVILTAQAANGSRENLETIVIARSRRA